MAYRVAPEAHLSPGSPSCGCCCSVLTDSGLLEYRGIFIRESNDLSQQWLAEAESKYGRHTRWAIVDVDYVLAAIEEKLSITKLQAEKAEARMVQAEAKGKELKVKARKKKLVALHGVARELESARGQAEVMLGWVLCFERP